MSSTLYRVGAVSFLNAKPLVYGLADRPEIALSFAVPSALPHLLDRDQLDVALVPVIDLVQPQRRWQLISDACIGCDGETLTVRVFSRVAPEDIHTLYVDGDSHTSVALAGVIWQERFGRRLEIRPLPSASAPPDCEALLLIGDKVVNHRFKDLDIETDLGGAWKSLTGLPFVFAAWAAVQGSPLGSLATWLTEARDEGVRQADRIAEEMGPHLGWPVELARRYLTHRLRFTLTPRHLEGLRLFYRMVQDARLIPGMQELVIA